MIEGGLTDIENIKTEKFLNYLFFFFQIKTLK